MTELEKLEARMSQYERALTEVGALQRTGRSVLTTAVAVFLGVGAIIGALNVYSISRVDTVGDRANDTANVVAEMKGEVIVIKGRLDSLDNNVTAIQADIRAISADTADLKLTSREIARALDIDPSLLEQPPTKPGEGQQ